MRQLIVKYWPTLLMGLLAAAYAGAFIQDLSPYWFNPRWTTDDALQQSYPLHAIQYPGIFAGDLITDTMKGYLAPLHYGLWYGITWLTRDPVMTGHWVMLIQVLLTLGFVFLAVRAATQSSAPAFFAAAWLLHTRTVMQRLTGGLPRGWAGAVMAAALYFMLQRRHKSVLVVLLAGCLLHPPATLIAAMMYGLYLIGGVLRPATRAAFIKPLLILICLSPLYALLTWQVVQRPPELGQMVGPREVAAMPAFSSSGGRFPFYPLRSIGTELRLFGYNPFLNRLYNPARTWAEFGPRGAVIGQYWRQAVPYIIVGSLLLLILLGRRQRRALIPAQFWACFAAIITVYLASRQIPFKLYVPDRHLLLPLSILLVTVFPTALWRAAGPEQRRSNGAAVAALLTLGLYVWLGTGSGLRGTANFNYTPDKRGQVFTWLYHHTPQDALIAGHPTHIDGVMLYAVRRGYATTETAHPFYPGYWQEIERRLTIAFKAHYARNLEELYELTAPEGITYFVFARKKFYPWALERERYFEPHTALVTELTSRPYRDYAYRELPRDVDLTGAPYLVFRDDQSVIVDISALGDYLRLSGRRRPESSEDKGG